jgi:hypothetical protein
LRATISLSVRWAQTVVALGADVRASNKTAARRCAVLQPTPALLQRRVREHGRAPGTKGVKWV